jgi:hypothetical protein
MSAPSIDDSGSTHERKSGVTYRTHYDDEGKVIKREEYKEKDSGIDESKVIAKKKQSLKERVSALKERVSKRASKLQKEEMDIDEEIAVTRKKRILAQEKAKLAKAKGQRADTVLKTFGKLGSNDFLGGSGKGMDFGFKLNDDWFKSSFEPKKGKKKGGMSPDEFYGF